MHKDLNEIVISEFSEKSTQLYYSKKAEMGLWTSEKYFFNKYLTKKNAKLLDVGCGTGRTTIPLFKKGFKIVGLDLVPEMIINAKKIAKKKKLKINYKIGDAKNIEFKDNLFDYAIFSNQGWPQIPGKENRLKALKEIYRVLKKDGVFIFTTNSRVFNKKYLLFWIKRWMRFYILKPFGVNIVEQNFGDILFDRKFIDGKKEYITRQYIHIHSIKEVESELKKAGFIILEINERSQRYGRIPKKTLPVLYVCKK